MGGLVLLVIGTTIITFGGSLGGIDEAEVATVGGAGFAAVEAGADISAMSIGESEAVVSAAESTEIAAETPTAAEITETTPEELAQEESAAEGITQCPQPKQFGKLTDHAIDESENGRDGPNGEMVGVSDAAMRDAFENPIKEPVPKADNKGGTWKYTGKDAVVVLNKDGDVVTCWPKSRNGWRYQPGEHPGGK